MNKVAGYEMRGNTGEWFGSLPVNWSILPLKYAFSIKKEIAGKLGYTVLSVTQKGIKPKDMLDKGQFALDYSKYQLVNRGEFIMNHMDLLTGWVDIATESGVTSPDYRVFYNADPAQFSSEYYKYIFQFCYSNKVFYGMGQGVAGFGRWRLPSSMFLHFLLPVPSINEQKAIAAYLDEQCALIDGAIEDAKASIEEYKAWKTSFIFDAVTKGLDHTSELQDSGSAWLGNVSCHAKISRVARHFQIILGKMLCSAQIDDSYTLEPYYCAANVHFDGISRQVIKKMWYSESEKDSYLVEEGDLLVVEGGAGAGGCTIVNKDESGIYIQNSIMIARNRRLGYNRYLRYLLEALVKRGYIDFVCNKATIPHFTKEKLGNVPFPVFPEDEVMSIVTHLDQMVAQVDRMLAEKTSLIAELESYKRSLIYETVTGKRKVE